MHWIGLIAGLFLAVASSNAADRSVHPIVSRIQRERVESSALAAVGYSPRLRALEIEFCDGLVYRYLEVPPILHRDLMAAESKARFYNKKVRGKYRSLRVRSKRTGQTNGASLVCSTSPPFAKQQRCVGA